MRYISLSISSNEREKKLYIYTYHIHVCICKAKKNKNEQYNECKQTQAKTTTIPHTPLPIFGQSAVYYVYQGAAIALPAEWVRSLSLSLRRREWIEYVLCSHCVNGHDLAILFLYSIHGMMFARWAMDWNAVDSWLFVLCFFSSLLFFPLRLSIHTTT